MKHHVIIHAFSGCFFFYLYGEWAGMVQCLHQDTLIGHNNKFELLGQTCDLNGPSRHELNVLLIVKLSQSC